MRAVAGRELTRGGKTMPRGHHSRLALAGRLALCALTLGACAAPTAAPALTATPTVVPPTATALPPTVAATPESTPANQVAVAATSYPLDGPVGVAFDADGNLYVSECGSSNANHKIFKVDRTGQLTVFAGSDLAGFSGDGGPAPGAQFACPQGLGFDRDGNLYVADLFNHRIRRIDRNGIVSTVAGSGPADTGGFAGDGGRADSARLDFPTDVAFGRDGNLYIADAGNNRVRKVDQQGIISTVAGSGNIPGYSGDGGPATAAELATSSTGNGSNTSINMGIAIDAEGNLYITDPFNYRIRKVDQQGIITTVAGNGHAGTSGDSGPATAASITFASFLAFDNQGNLFFSEGPAAGIYTHHIRKVDKNGIITTGAGAGDQGFSGDGGPAVLAALFYPLGIDFDQAGNLYVVDNGNNRVRKVDENGIITTVAGGHS